ncbi:MAG: sigma-70 family RNA polymerase sigma factor [Bacteroidetes bacterium]|nr:sigma-70 family RNA polymerase sigma factor [Bacteroidota bacterium]
MQEFKAEEILEGLQNRDTDILDYVYRNFFNQIKDFVIQNDGNEEDAKDVYQDAILVIYQKVRKDNLTLSCSFNTYLYSVCRLLWLKQLEYRKTFKKVIEESAKFIELDEDITNIYKTNERFKLYQDHFKRLSYNCQKILELFLARIQLKEIARILRLKSDDYVKKRKHQCKEKLISSIKNDPRFKELMKQ